MIYVYRRWPSASAVELAHALEGRKVRRVPRRGTLICWGEHVPNAIGGQPIINKFEELEALRASGVPTVEFTNRPMADWLGRREAHVGGRDFTDPPQRPDYWVKRETLIREFRVHSFMGKSIRAGEKLPRVGFENAHPWVRSYDSGWRIVYTGSVGHGVRELAHKAVSALALTWGAVDIGQRADGSLLVLEVNRAPGLEGGTIVAYADAFRRLLAQNTPQETE